MFYQILQTCAALLIAYIIAGCIVKIPRANATILAVGQILVWVLCAFVIASIWGLVGHLGGPVYPK